MPRYRIRTGDTLYIAVAHETDSGMTVPVMPDGRITYLFDVELVAAGKTYAQLRAELRGQLNRYFIDPQITVVGRSFAGNSVFVMGPISKPGPHAIQNDTRLLDILATAGVLGMQPRLGRAWTFAASAFRGSSAHRRFPQAAPVTSGRRCFIRRRNRSHTRASCVRTLVYRLWPCPTRSAHYCGWPPLRQTG